MNANWQPIATAPKDRNFDAWAKKWNCSTDTFEYRRFTNCDFAGDKKSVRYWVGSSGKDLFSEGFYATHWMEIPEPPKENQL